MNYRYGTRVPLPSINMANPDQSRVITIRSHWCGLNLNEEVVRSSKYARREYPGIHTRARTILSFLLGHGNELIYLAMYSNR